MTQVSNGSAELKLPRLASGGTAESHSEASSGVISFRFLGPMVLSDSLERNMEMLKDEQ